MSKLNSSLILLSSCLLIAGCATKNFGELDELSPTEVAAMSCDEIDSEFHQLEQYEDSVDEEASTGQAKQIFWGGLWSVMADNKLERIARKDIRKRIRFLYEAKKDKGCK